MVADVTAADRYGGVAMKGIKHSCTRYQRENTEAFIAKWKLQALPMWSRKLIAFVEGL